MSTLSGVASKGEKSKSKFQSLDINNLYRVSRGENLEKQQQKNTLQYKHGMQSLGKVPNARRAPANLPSLKSEHSGTDASVPLVPPGGPGWGKQESTSATSTTTSTTTTASSATPPSNPPPPQLSSHQAAIALPVQTTIPPQVKHAPIAPICGPVAVVNAVASAAAASSAVSANVDKSWSSITSAPNDSTIHPPLYQSPQFQQEFPSLEGGGTVPGGGQIGPGGQQTAAMRGADGGGVHHYAPGLSLRPQTEGSWIQGGSRNSGPDGGARSSSVPLGAPPQLAAQVGLQQQQQQAPLPPQFRNVLPNFMCKGNFVPTQPHLGPNNNNQIPMNNGRKADNGGRGGPLGRLIDDEIQRPIIKEEELSRMVEIDKDMGWTAHDDIDYNQKLDFSDDDITTDRGMAGGQGLRRSEQRPPSRDMERNHETNEGAPPRGWNRQQQHQRNSEEEQWKIRRSQHNKDLELTVQRAKQRKEEEEKRFNESTKQGAAKKLQELEEKMSKRNKDDENVGTISPSVVPPKPIVSTDIPLPDFQRDKERDRDSRSRTPNDDKNRDNSTTSASSFRQLTTIEGKNNFANARNKQQQQHAKGGAGGSNDPRERDRELREQNGPNFSKHFQLPPRFQKQKNMVPNFQQFPPKTHNPDDIEEQPPQQQQQRDYKRQGSDDSHRSNSRFVGGDEYEYGRRSTTSNTNAPTNQRNETSSKDSDWHRPARPDSRDSRTSRHSRDSEPRDHIGSWAETPFEYEERRRDDRRVVPGPITKDRIEADDMRITEKRNLTQLKRGGGDKKSTDKKDADKDALDGKKEDSGPKAWASDVATSLHSLDSDSVDVLKHDEGKKSDKNDSDFKEDRRGGGGANRNRNYAPSKGWGGGGNDYHRQNWGGGGGKRAPQPNRGGPGRSQRDFHGTDSEGSMDDQNLEQRSPKPVKKSDKDDKNKEIKLDRNKQPLDGANKDLGGKRDGYVPRGEPSRHGRGGGNFRSRGGAGMGKRIDGYGPPPSKSPFGRHDDKKPTSTINEENGAVAVSVEDKSAKNQQALTAGITGAGARKEGGDKSRLLDDKLRNRKGANERGNDSRRSAAPSGAKPPKRRDDENVDSNSDNSDEKNRKNALRKQNPPPRLAAAGDKKPTFGSNNQVPRQNSSGALRNQPKKDDASVNSDSSLKSSENVPTTQEDGDTIVADSDGFQEVKSKKSAVKERQKWVDDKPTMQSSKQPSKPQDKDPQQQISNIPPLMATPVNPPTNLLATAASSSSSSSSSQQSAQSMTSSSSKQSFERPRQNKLAPRFAKQRESNRLQKVQHNIHPQNMCDEMKKIGVPPPQMNMYGGGGGMKENVAVNALPNAWDSKSLGTQLTDSVLGGERKAMEIQDGVSPRTSPNDDKIIGNKGSQMQQDKALLDGATPPVNTIIFENTNFKSAPGARSTRPTDKVPTTRKLDETLENAGGIGGYAKPIGDLLCKPDKQSESAMMLSLDNADIKLDFFESDLSHLTEDSRTTATSSSSSSATAKNLCISRSSTVSASDDLNFKIQSVKKMWETPAEHGVVVQEDSFGSSFDPNVSLDPTVAFKGSDGATDVDDAYSGASPNQVAVAAANNTTNVCKVKPTQQVTGGGGGAVVGPSPGMSGGVGHQHQQQQQQQQQHSGGIMGGPSLMANPLSPPPIQPVIGTGVNLGQPHQYATNQHMGYQASLGGSNYGLSAIPSPPTVMYNSSAAAQQLQQTANMYGAFQIDQSGVLGQRGSQYSQYAAQYAAAAAANLGQTASSPYSTQSMYLQTAAHPPPTGQAPPPDLYQNLSNYRMGAANAANPFGQNQQLNNPTTVLISSTSNSLMSASVKPSTQQISAIGTKAGGVGQAYQPQSQQSQQVYMAYEPTLQPNYLPNAMQRAPTGPVQNNVVPGLQSTSSYYSGSTGQTGYYQQPNNSTMQSAQLQQHQAGYGLQTNVFGTHNQSSAGLQSFSSHFLSTQSMQMAAALNAQQQQQYRSGLPAQYIKSLGEQSVGRSQQLKSPGSQEVISSVFNSGSQISSPKLRQNCKQPPPQPSPTAQHKYPAHLYQNVGNQQQLGNRYPAPIQRPVNFQQQNMNSMQKHRTNNTNNKAPSRQYYQSNSIQQNDSKQGEDAKIASDNTLTNAANATNKMAVSAAVAATSAVPAADLTKDPINIEENSSTLKD